MKLLLDTHILLWALAEPHKLSASQAEALQEGELFVSAATVWEVGIKRALGKLDVPETVFDVALQAGCKALPITWRHADMAAALPAHHNDPFDRMLIAQAQCEGLALCSADRAFSAYDVTLLS